MLKRLFTQYLLGPDDVSPSHPDMQVIGVFNPGAVALQGNGGGADGQVVLMVRVAEQPKNTQPGYTALPRYEPIRGVVIDQVPNDELTPIDPRVVYHKKTNRIRLTFISHLRVMRSNDGRTIDTTDGPRLMPSGEYETFGVEDPRITRIGDRYYITYVAVSPHGAATALASTTDFETFERYGIIFYPENKDVLLFPEKIAGRYMAIHRPNPATPFSPPAMWLARSDDLIRWGQHQRLWGGGSSWDGGRVGGGCPPIRTDQGWLEIYHANDKSAQDNSVGTYFGAAFLMDLDNPARVVAASREPIMAPEADFETNGFVPNVVFPTAVIERGNTLLVYYGAGDTHCGVVGYDRDELLGLLHETEG